MATQRGSLIVVGVGLDGPAQTTAAAITCMRRADRLLYLVTDPLTVHWLRRLNPTATALDDLYGAEKPRRQTYEEMTERILDAVREGHSVCAAFYGHPGVFAMPPHWAVARARRLGFHARMLPGVSADACLYADLGLNPGNYGVQSYEATDFLASRRRFDPTSELILWQVGVLGESNGRVPSAGQRVRRVQRLSDRLRRWYPGAHRVVLYQAATFAGSTPLVKRLPLERLSRARIGPRMTLYVPALPQRRRDASVVEWYGANVPIIKPSTETAAVAGDRSSVGGRSGDSSRPRRAR
jgi:precorrin-6B methylase 1